MKVQIAQTTEDYDEKKTVLMNTALTVQDTNGVADIMKLNTMKSQ